jgi:hypothetical protein
MYIRSTVVVSKWNGLAMTTTTIMDIRVCPRKDTIMFSRIRNKGVRLYLNMNCNHFLNNTVLITLLELIQYVWSNSCLQFHSIFT